MLAVPKYLMNEEFNKAFITAAKKVVVRSTYRNSRRHQKVILVVLYDNKAILGVIDLLVINFCIAVILKKT